MQGQRRFQGKELATEIQFTPQLQADKDRTRENRVLSTFLTHLHAFIWQHRVMSLSKG
jgi:hypothetical protein